MANCNVRIGYFLYPLLSLFCLISIGSSDLEHNLKFSSFDYGIRNQEFAKLCDPVDGTIPSPNGSSNYVGFFVSWYGTNDSSNSVLKPSKKAHFCVSNGDVGLINGTFAIFDSGNGSGNVNSSFSVHNSCEVSNFWLRKDSSVKVCLEPLSPKGERFLLHRLSNEMSPQAFNVRSSRPRQSLGYRDGDMLAESVSLSKGAIHLGPEGPSFLASEDKAPILDVYGVV